MIQPPRFRGTVFSEASDGDLRSGDRHHFSASLGIGSKWATSDQVHGIDVIFVAEAGNAGPADALVSDTVGLPVAVFTADCLGVVIETDRGVCVAHAGWRGLVAGVLSQVLGGVGRRGWTPLRAAIGPSIGPCCFEVGPEVLAEFPGFEDVTSWGSPSVDLWSAARRQLRSVDDVWLASRCTRCDPSFLSHRRDGTAERMAAVGWVP